MDGVQVCIKVYVHGIGYGRHTRQCIEYANSELDCMFIDNVLGHSLCFARFCDTTAHVGGPSACIG
jgi:hypothetical protein